jgi:hypothetical protein
VNLPRIAHQRAEKLGEIFSSHRHENIVWNIDLEDQLGPEIRPFNNSDDTLGDLLRGRPRATHSCSPSACKFCIYSHAGGGNGAVEPVCQLGCSFVAHTTATCR